MIYRVIILILFLSNIAYGQKINHIVIKGNERIEEDTVKSYIDIIPGVEFNQELLDSSVKKLYASSLFQKVDLSVQGGDLYIKLVENPKINLVVFEGNSKVKTKDLESEISLKPRGIYTKAKVQEDVNRIIDLYNKNGRFSAKVTPQIISLPQNRVNLIYKIEEGPVAKIGKIVFIGNKAFHSDTLESELSSRETRWYYFLSSSDQFNPLRLEYDRELLTRFYHSRGYAEFKIISIITNISENKERFYITITIDEGNKYKFGQIDLDSMLKTSNLSLNDLKNEITTKEKEVYDVKKVEQSVDKMIKRINDQGFAFVDVEPEIRLDNEKLSANIIYHIGESRKVYINRINITGNVRTIDKVIRREFRLSEGDPYNATKISRSEKRINDLDFFEPVSVETVRSERSSDKVDLNVNLQEKSTTSLNFAGGYSTADGPIGRIGLNENNLLGKGQQLGVGFTKASRRFDVDLSFTEPYMFDRPISGGVDLYSRTTEHNNSQYRHFDQRNYGFLLRSGYFVTEFLTHGVHYGLSKSQISNVSSDASDYIKDQQGTKVTSLIGHSLAYDRRDKTINTSEGYIVNFTQDFAGLGGSSKFLRHGILGRYYYPVLNEDVILVFGGDAGHISGIDGRDVGISDRYFIGGAETLRGFDAGGIGPRDKETGSSLGGNTYYTGTAELKFPLGFGKDLGLFGSLFIDAGTLYNVDVADKNKLWDSKSLRSAYGVGIGFTTPMGPIRVHYAIPISKEHFDRTKNFDISFRTNF
jgi:outer membrane protein insertion porin family